MNETRRDDIYQFDDAEIAAHPIVQRMVQEAVAARDAEIREALLSDEVVGAAAKAMCDDGLVGDGDMNDARAGLQAALAAMGAVTEEEQGDE